MKHYQADEFINPETIRTAIPESMKDTVDKKVSLLYDFWILCRHKRQPDPREPEVRAFLSHYATEQEMTIALHTVLNGTETIDHRLSRWKEETNAPKHIYH